MKQYWGGEGGGAWGGFNNPFTEKDAKKKKKEFTKCQVIFNIA